MSTESIAPLADSSSSPLRAPAVDVPPSQPPAPDSIQANAARPAPAAVALVGAPAAKRATKRVRVERPTKRPVFDWRFYDRLVRESPLEPQASREMLAETAVTLRAQIVTLRTKLEEQGKLTGDEHRALSGACSNLRRVCETLGASKTDDVPDFSGGDE